jgi:hypothetical protein
MTKVLTTIIDPEQILLQNIKGLIERARESVIKSQCGTCPAQLEYWKAYKITDFDRWVV